MMKNLISIVTALMITAFISAPVRANNIAVTNVFGTDRVNGSHWMVQFDISWTNSWRCDLPGAGQGEPYNYDAAWVFIKYRVGGTSDWRHATLSTNAADHVAPTGATINPGLDGRTGAWGTNGIGAFIFRSTNGSNLFTANNTKLRWKYAADGVADGTPIDLKVCAIEMVSVPTGAFYAGSATNGDEVGRFIEGYGAGASNNTPFLVQTEGQISVSNQPNCLWGVSQSGSETIGPQGVLSNAFPKGYSAFYGMKHEITQAQYVDFLNALTRNQQTNRFFSTNVNDFMNSIASNIPSYRNGVQLTSDPGAPNPRVYANNLDTNNAPNSTNDGQWIACNYINSADFEAYLDWAGLRPMSELEFEKACRGTNAPVKNEFAWGTAATGNYATNTVNSGTANESAQPTDAYFAASGGIVLPGPIRVGCYGIGQGTRVKAGAGYYGILELSANLWEHPVTVAYGRFFTGQHGNGVLTSDGKADVALWPDAESAWGGFGNRGGAFVYSSTWSYTANRGSGAGTSAGRFNYYGGRGVRSAP